MRYLVPAAIISFSALPIFLVVGVRPFCAPYPHVKSMASARDYWLEYEQGGEGLIRHKYGGKWPLDFEDWGQRGDADLCYFGESGRLWKIQIPSIREPFLVFDACHGAYSMRRVLFRITNDGLVPAGDIRTVFEITSDLEEDVVAATFEDMTGDGIPELREDHREWMTNKQGELIDNWAIRTVYHQWDGTRFRPTHERLVGAGVVGPLEVWRPQDPLRKATESRSRSAAPAATAAKSGTIAVPHPH